MHKSFTGTVKLNLTHASQAVSGVPNPRFHLELIRKYRLIASSDARRDTQPQDALGNVTQRNKELKKMTENADVIFIGNKPPMSYVLAIITSLSSGAPKEITLKARGQAITTAVDVAEIARNRFVKDLKVIKIAIGTAEMPPREGETKSRMVSTMEITLKK